MERLAALSHVGFQNPALAGIFSGDPRIQGVYRNQWNSVTVPYQTGSLNAEYKLPVGHSDDYLTLGGEILYDKAGTVALTATHILPVINYHKSLSQEKANFKCIIPYFLLLWEKVAVGRMRVSS